MTGEQGANSNGHPPIDIDLDAVIGRARTLRYEGQVYELMPISKALRRAWRLARESGDRAQSDAVGERLIRECLPGLDPEDAKDMHPAQQVALVRAIWAPVDQAERLTGELSAAASGTASAGSASGGTVPPATTG